MSMEKNLKILIYKEIKYQTLLLLILLSLLLRQESLRLLLLRQESLRLLLLRQESPLLLLLRQESPLLRLLAYCLHQFPI
jgi:hypothetical protein